MPQMGLKYAKVVRYSILVADLSTSPSQKPLAEKSYSLNNLARVMGPGKCTITAVPSNVVCDMEFSYGVYQPRAHGIFSSPPLLH